MDCSHSVFLSRQQSFDTLDEKMEGIILIVGLRLGQEQKFLPSGRLRCSSILNPMFQSVGVRAYYRHRRVNLRYSSHCQFLADRQSSDGSSEFAGAVAAL